jgi:hypothetical protein
VIGGGTGFASESRETDETAGRENLCLLQKMIKRSGQVHQETLDMYTDELKKKRAANGKLTKNLKEKRLEEVNDLSTSVPNLSPALAQAIGLFEVDGMTILLQVEGG